MDNLRGKVYPLFSKPVFIADLEITDSEKTILLNHYDNQEYYLARDKFEHEDSCKISKNKNILGELDWLNKKIEDKFQQFCDEVMHYENKIGIINSWFTKTNKNEESTYHHHSNFMWTGSFYFGNDENYQQKITLKNFNPSLLSVPSKEQNIYNSVAWTFTIKNNMVIYFPSELNHMISKNNNETIRKSLAFNMLPIDEVDNGVLKVKLHETQ